MHHFAKSTNDDLNYLSGILNGKSIGTVQIALNFGVKGVNVTHQNNTGDLTLIILTSVSQRFGSPALTRRTDMFLSTSDLLCMLKFCLHFTYKQQINMLKCIVQLSIFKALCDCEEIYSFELLDLS